jgi:hypothetical protein
MSGVYQAGKLAFAAGTITWVGSTLKVMLLTSAYVYSPNENFVSAALTAAEVTGAGYTGGYGGAGRIAIPSKALARNDANGLIEHDAGPVTWASLNVGSVAACAIIFETGGSDATALPIVYINGGFPLASAGGPFTLTPAATGLLQLTG